MPDDEELTEEQVARLLKSSFRPVSAEEAADLSDEDIVQLPGTNANAPDLSPEGLTRLVEALRDQQTSSARGGEPTDPDGNHDFLNPNPASKSFDAQKMYEKMLRQESTAHAAELWSQATLSMVHGQSPQSPATADTCTAKMAEALLLDEKGCSIVQGTGQAGAIERCARESLSRGLTVEANVVLGYIVGFGKGEFAQSCKFLEAAISAKTAALQSVSPLQESAGSSPATAAEQQRLQQRATLSADRHPLSRIHGLLSGMYAFRRSYAQALQHLHKALSFSRTATEASKYHDLIGKCYNFLGNHAEAKKFLDLHLEHELPVVESSKPKSKLRTHMCNTLYTLVGLEYTLGLEKEPQKHFLLAERLRKTVDDDDRREVDGQRAICVGQKRRAEAVAGGRQNGGSSCDGRNGSNDLPVFKEGDVVEVIPPATKYVGERGEVVAPAATKGRFIVRFKHWCVTVHGAKTPAAPAKKASAASSKASSTKGATSEADTTTTIKEISFQTKHLKLIFSKHEAEQASKEFFRSARQVLENGRFCFGDEVLIDGLLNRAELNGRRGIIRRALSEWRARYEVELLEEGTQYQLRVTQREEVGEKSDGEDSFVSAESPKSGLTKQSPSSPKSDSRPKTLLHIQSKNLKRAPQRQGECPICLDEIKSPIALDACGHRFCSACVDDVLQNLSKNNTQKEYSAAACPLCRTAMTGADTEKVAQIFASRRQVALCSSCAIVPVEDSGLPRSLPRTAGLRHYRDLYSQPDLAQALAEELRRGLPEGMAEHMDFLGEDFNKARTGSTKPARGDNAEDDEERHARVMKAFEEDYAHRRRQHAEQFAAGVEADGEHRNLFYSQGDGDYGSGQGAAASGRAADPGDEGTKKSKNKRKKKGAVSSAQTAGLLGGRDVVGRADDGSDDPVVQKACNIKLNKLDAFGDGDQSRLSIRPGTPGPDLEAYWSTGGNFSPLGQNAGIYSALLRAAAWGNRQEVAAILEEFRKTVPADQMEEKLKQLLERRESSMRASPLYACIIGARHMNERDPRCLFAWLHRPPKEEIDHYGCAELLLDAGANPNAKVSRGILGLSMVSGRKSCASSVYVYCCWLLVCCTCFMTRSI